MESLNKGREWKAVAFCLLAAFAALLICSMNSPLYPLNPWNDVNCYMTVGQEMLRGGLPYRDLIEHKGPLMYALHALALLISPGNYHGIWVIEVVLMAGALYCFYKIARLYAPEISVGWVAVAAAVICMSRSFRYGDSAEELCLLPMAWSLYALLKSWRTGVPLTGRQYLLHGVLAGCILWTKFNLLGFHLVWMGFQAIDALIADRSLKRPVKMCLWFLGGMALTAVPWLIQYGAGGALDDLVRVYFQMNLFGYGPRRHNIFVYTLVGLMRGMEDWRLSVPLVVVSAILLLTPRRKMPVKEKLYLFCTAAVMAVSIYGMGMRFRYYYLPFALLLPFVAIALGGLSRWLSARRRLNAAFCAVLLAVSMAVALRVSLNTKWIGYRYEDTAQGQVAELLKDEESPTLLNVGALDAGFYFALDARPPIENFAMLNINREKCLCAQKECLDAGAVEYAVTTDETLADLGMGGNYELIKEMQDKYGGEWRMFRLYRKKGADM